MAARENQRQQQNRYKREAGEQHRALHYRLDLGGQGELCLMLRIHHDLGPIARFQLEKTGPAIDQVLTERRSVHPVQYVDMPRVVPRPLFDAMFGDHHRD